jgi:hypothetical protein
MIIIMIYYSLKTVNRNTKGIPRKFCFASYRISVMVCDISHVLHIYNNSNASAMNLFISTQMQVFVIGVTRTIYWVIPPCYVST